MNYALDMSAVLVRPIDCTHTHTRRRSIWFMHVFECALNSTGCLGCVQAHSCTANTVPLNGEAQQRRPRVRRAAGAQFVRSTAPNAPPLNCATATALARFDIDI